MKESKDITIKVEMTEAEIKQLFHYVDAECDEKFYKKLCKARKKLIIKTNKKLDYE